MPAGRAEKRAEASGPHVRVTVVAITGHSRHGARRDAQARYCLRDRRRHRARHDRSGAQRGRLVPCAAGADQPAGWSDERAQQPAGDPTRPAARAARAEAALAAANDPTEVPRIRSSPPRGRRSRSGRCRGRRRCRLRLRPHRLPPGLDHLRHAGWKGHGPVPWSHAPNQGFLRALAALARAAAEDRRGSRGPAVPGLPRRMRSRRSRDPRTGLTNRRPDRDTGGASRSAPERMRRASRQSSVCRYQVQRSVVRSATPSRHTSVGWQPSWHGAAPRHTAPGVQAAHRAPPGPSARALGPGLPPTGKLARRSTTSASQ